MPDPDFAAAGLLDGLDESERADRLALLKQLAEDGFQVEELAAAARENRLPLLGIERLLGGRYNAREIEARTGLDAQLMVRLRRLLGLSEVSVDERAFGDDDVEIARSTKLFLDAGFELETLAELTRVLGESMSRVATAVTAAFAQTFLRPGDSEAEVARRFTSLAEQLTPALAPVLVGAFNSHLREAVHRGMIGRTELETGQLPGAVELTICFADLVGFTRLGGQLEVQELGSVAGTLARLAADLAQPPVRLVKTIGDAAMFVSTEPEPLVATALALVDAVEAEDLPSLRAGIALGPVVQRSGDFFGHCVNLASRVTGVARPGSVLATAAVRDATPEQFDWSFAGQFRLKGVPERVPLHRARPIPPPARAERPETARRRPADRRRRRASS